MVAAGSAAFTSSAFSACLPMAAVSLWVSGWSRVTATILLVIGVTLVMLASATWSAGCSTAAVAAWAGSDCPRSKVTRIVSVSLTITDWRSRSPSGGVGESAQAPVVGSRGSSTVAAAMVAMAVRRRMWGVLLRLPSNPILAAACERPCATGGLGLGSHRRCHGSRWEHAGVL